MLTRDGLIMSHKEYSITLDKERKAVFAVLVVLVVFKTNHQY